MTGEATGSHRPSQQDFLKALDRPHCPGEDAHDVPPWDGGYKREEFSNDTEDDERGDLIGFFDNVRIFCIEDNKSNCLLVDKDLHDADARKIDELVDLKFLHKINPRVTVRNRTGRIFSAFMLDLSQYVGARKQRNVELLEFWRSDRVDDLRKASLIFLERPWPGATN